ncbi:MAG: polyprenyl diphosphate synthase [Patescibacteria group bacterium]
MTQKTFHLAIILDGNRRWARKRALPAAIGHQKGAENLKKLLPTFISHGITHLTVYALSTENLQERSASELKNIFREIERFAKDEEIFHENKIRLQLFGEIAKFPISTKKALRNLVEHTKNYRELTLNLALGYGGRDEIVRAVNKFAETGQRATEKNFGKFLDSGDQPDPDLLIRTGGKRRISNFLIWQLAYAELYFTEKMWPQFDEAELEKALKWFQEQKRTFGK